MIRVSALEGVTQNDGFIAVRTGRDQVDGHAAYLCHALEVTTRLSREFVELGDPYRRLAPAGELLEHGFGLCDGMGAVGQYIAEFAIDTIADAQLDCLQTVEHVEFGDAQTVDAVQA